MVNPVQPSTQNNLFLPLDTFPGQKMERKEEIPRPVVDRKQDIPSAREEVPREEVEQAVEKINRLMGIIDKRLEFKVHEQSHRVMVKVIDQETGDVLDEIPSKRLLDILSSFTQIAGILVDKLA